jgi:hypothetical protein
VGDLDAEQLERDRPMAAGAVLVAFDCRSVLREVGEQLERDRPIAASVAAFVAFVFVFVNALDSVTSSGVGVVSNACSGVAEQVERDRPSVADDDDLEPADGVVGRCGTSAEAVGEPRQLTAAPESSSSSSLFSSARSSAADDDRLSSRLLFMDERNT